MNISILDVLGPVMVGPSSSHTAGALKLARTAMQLSGKPFSRVEFLLHGSFARTGKGHGTDRALLAGAMGLRETDERIRSAYDEADARGLRCSFGTVELADAHENSCVINFYHDDGEVTSVVGSSVGGGSIVITSLDGIPTEITASSPTLAVRQYDRKGVVGAVTNLLAENGINIAVMRLGRAGKGAQALTVIETDTPVPAALADEIARLDNVISARVLE